MGTYVCRVAAMASHHSGPLGRNRDIRRQFAGLVTWTEVRLPGRAAGGRQKTSRVTARPVTPGQCGDRLDAVAVAGMGGRPRGHRPHYRARRALVRNRARSTIG